MTNAIAASITTPSTIIAFIVVSPQLRVSFPRPEQLPAPHSRGTPCSASTGENGAGKVSSFAHGLNSGLIQQTQLAVFVGDQPLALHPAQQTSHGLARAARQFGDL